MLKKILKFPIFIFIISVSILYFSEKSYSLTINELFQLIEENSDIIIAEREYLDKFRNDIYLAEISNDPSITLSGNIGAKIQENSSGRNDFNPRSLSLTLTQNLYDGNRSEYTILQAKDLLTQSQYNFENLKQGIFLQSVNAYLDLVKLRQILQITKENVSLSENYLNFTKNDLELGNATENELNQATVTFEKNKFNLNKIEEQIRNQENLLFNYINTIPDDINILDFSKVNLNRNFDYFHNLAMENNPNILANELRLAILRYGLVIEESANKPRVDLEAGITRSWDYTASAGQADELSIMGRVSVPLNETEQVRLKQKNVALEINRHERVLYDLKYNLKREIDNTINNIKLLELEFEIEEKQKEVLENDVLIERESYSLGISSTLDVYESEIELNNQSLTLIELDNNIYKSYFSLLNQLGELKVNQ